MRKRNCRSKEHWSEGKSKLHGKLKPRRDLPKVINQTQSKNSQSRKQCCRKTGISPNPRSNTHHCECHHDCNSTEPGRRSVLQTVTDGGRNPLPMNTQPANCEGQENTYGSGPEHRGDHEN